MLFSFVFFFLFLLYAGCKEVTKAEGLKVTRDFHYVFQQSDLYHSVSFFSCLEGGHA
jgi:hypothetical protein